MPRFREGSEGAELPPEAIAQGPSFGREVSPGLEEKSKDEAG